MSRRLAVGLLTLALLAGCSNDDEGGGADTAPAATQPPGPTRLAITPLTVTLQSGGRQPQVPLTQGLDTGATSVGQLVFALGVEGVTSASVSGDSELEVTGVADDGLATVDYGLTGLDIAVGAGGAEGAPTSDALDVTGTFEVGPTREVTAASVETVTTGELPGVEAVADTLDPRLAFLLLPFPAEPVGVGAAWRVEGVLPVFGAAVDLTADLQLIERREGRWVVTATLAMATADPGAGPDITLEGLGRVAGDLGRLGARRGSIGMDGTIVLPDRGPQPLPMTLELQVQAQ